MKVLLLVYDNDAYIHWFPQGLAYIAAVLKRAGHDVDIYSQDMWHYPDEHLTAYLDNNEYDMIGVSVIAGYYQYRKLLKIAAAVNKARKRPFFVIGGHGPSPEPEFFLRKTGADAVVMGEGEETVLELMDAIAGNADFLDVRGIAFRRGDEVVINDRRPLIQDIDTIPMPAYELFPMEYYRLLRMPHSVSGDFVMPMLSGRGCTFQCTFCYRMDEGFRPRSNASIIDEIKFLREKYSVNYIAFADELLMSSVKRTEGLCEDFLSEGLDIKWTCNGRLNYARPELLKLMKRAGCTFINYGIESMDNDVLRNMNKKLDVDQIIKGIEATLDSGISPGFNIIFGNIGDNRETLRKGVEFLIKYDDGAQMRTIRPVTPYPGSPLYDHAIEKGLVADCEDFYENKHLNSDLMAVNFTELSDKEFNLALFEANVKLLNNYHAHRMASSVEQCVDIYINENVNFRGFRHT